jgi:flagellar biosynthetic protein FliO
VTDLLSLRAFLSLVMVLALLAGALWALRRGALRLPALKGRVEIVVETATSLGDRRSLAIVRVEGRRLLVGLTPSAVSFLTDLQPAPVDASVGTKGRS